jgi:hypothetical protein
MYVLSAEVLYWQLLVVACRADSIVLTNLGSSAGYTSGRAPGARREHGEGGEGTADEVRVLRQAGVGHGVDAAVQGKVLAQCFLGVFLISVL